MSQHAGQQRRALRKGHWAPRKGAHVSEGSRLSTTVPDRGERCNTALQSLMRDRPVRARRGARPRSRSAQRVGKPRMRAPFRLEPRGNRAAPLVFKSGGRDRPSPYAGTASRRCSGTCATSSPARSRASRSTRATGCGPTRPAELLGRTRPRAGRRREGTPTLVEAMGRPVWIDFVADTGDDRDVSHAVGRMMFREYEVQRGWRRVGRCPAATCSSSGATRPTRSRRPTRSIARVIAPWNEALREATATADPTTPRERARAPRHPRQPRLVRRARRLRAHVPPQAEPVDEADVEPPATRRAPRGARVRRARKGASRARRAAASPGRGGRAPRHPRRTCRGRCGRSCEARGVSRRKRLVLAGYEPDAGVELLGASARAGPRRCGASTGSSAASTSASAATSRARRRAAPDARIVFVAPDPAIAFGETLRERRAHAAGVQALARARPPLLPLRRHAPLRATARSATVAAPHRGRRRRIPSRHAHRARPQRPAACAYPTRAMTRALVAQVPVKLMLGRRRLPRARRARRSSRRSSSARELGRARFRVTSVAHHHRHRGSRLYVIAAASARARRGAVLAFAVPFALGLGLMPVGARALPPRDLPALERDTARACSSTRSSARSSSASSWRSWPSPGSSTSRPSPSSGTRGSSTSCACASPPTERSRRGPSAKTTRSPSRTVAHRSVRWDGVRATAERGARGSRPRSAWSVIGNVAPLSARRSRADRAVVAVDDVLDDGEAEARARAARPSS